MLLCINMLSYFIVILCVVEIISLANVLLVFVDVFATVARLSAHITTH